MTGASLSQPSYIRKADRAEQHIVNLTLLLAVFEAKHPYTVTDPVENKRGERFSTLYNPAEVRTTRYRYRGAAIPPPWLAT